MGRRRAVIFLNDEARMSYEITASSNASISVKCERCARTYLYGLQELASHVTSERPPESPISEPFRWMNSDHNRAAAVSKLRARIEGRSGVGDFGFSRCPACGHLQSWMRTSRRKAFGTRIFGLSLLFTVGVAGIAYLVGGAPRMSWDQWPGETFAERLWWVAGAATLVAVLTGLANMIAGRLLDSQARRQRRNRTEMSGGPLDVRFTEPDIRVTERSDSG